MTPPRWLDSLLWRHSKAYRRREFRRALVKLEQWELAAPTPHPWTQRYKACLQTSLQGKCEHCPAGDGWCCVCGQGEPRHAR